MNEIKFGYREFTGQVVDERAHYCNIQKFSAKTWQKKIFTNTQKNVYQVIPVPLTFKLLQIKLLLLS